MSDADDFSVRHWIALRRRWPYWNWVVWETVTKPYRETLIVDEGLTIRQATAERKAQASIDRMETLWTS